MRRLDRFLQSWRTKVARPWVPAGSQVLDIGCHQGEFLKSLGDRIGPSIGIDPLASPRRDHATGSWRSRSANRSPFPIAASIRSSCWPPSSISETRSPWLVSVTGCSVRAGVCSLPSRPRSSIGSSICSGGSGWRMACRWTNTTGTIRATPELFERHGFSLEDRRTFQFGLNHLFVFRKPPARAELNSGVA